MLSSQNDWWQPAAWHRHAPYDVCSVQTSQVDIGCGDSVSARRSFCAPSTVVRSKIRKPAAESSEKGPFTSRAAARAAAASGSDGKLARLSWSTRSPLRKMLISFGRSTDRETTLHCAFSSTIFFDAGKQNKPFCHSSGQAGAVVLSSSVPFPSVLLPAALASSDPGKALAAAAAGAPAELLTGADGAALRGGAVLSASQPSRWRTSEPTGAPLSSDGSRSNANSSHGASLGGRLVSRTTVVALH
mmetsp:Transcript_11445/g.30322  ORF Transcript_11445/g.30322 Transcript_11445/m.30322 type:complete len:245 (+) Transcript_11445:1635-2369(+)